MRFTAQPWLSRLTSCSPARAFLETNVAGPEHRPVRGVRDERKATRDRDVEAVRSFHSLHRTAQTLGI
jgi:hypothetical protein